MPESDNNAVCIDNLKIAENLFKKERDILSVKDVMSLLGVGKNTVYSLIKSGQLQALQTKGKGVYKIPKTSLKYYVAKNI